MGTPFGSSHAGSIDGHCEAGAVNRAFGCAAGSFDVGRPIAAVPVDEMRWRVAQAFPPHVAIVGEGDVGEDGVLRDGCHGVRIRLLVRARRDAKKARLRVDRVDQAVVGRLDPGDVVADGPDLPAVEPFRRNHHREVRLAARARERGADVRLLAAWRSRRRRSACARRAILRRARSQDAMRSAKHFLPSSALPP